MRQMQGEGSFGSERAAGSDSIILDENEVLTELELQLVEELKKRVIKCKEDPRSPCVKNLNQILMKFPTIKGGFESLKDIFVGGDEVNLLHIVSRVALENDLTRSNTLTPAP